MIIIDNNKEIIVLIHSWTEDSGTDPDHGGMTLHGYLVVVAHTP